MGSDKTPPGVVQVDRFSDRTHAALIALGTFEPLFRAYLDHARRWDEVPDGLTEVMMRQGLAAAALHLSCRPRDELMGWTLSIQEPPINIFLGGDAQQETIVGRAFQEHVQEAPHNRLYVQTRRPGAALRDSVIDVTGLDLLGVFEQYYARSEQAPARFFEYDDGTFIMVLGLPGLDRAWLDALDREAARAYVEQSALTELDHRAVRFACGCGPERIARVLQAAYVDDLDGLFQGDPQVEVECPRCGHRWLIGRAAVEEAARPDGEGEKP